MENIDIKQAKLYTKKLLFSVAELADMINEMDKDTNNYKVAELVFRLHRPMRQFQSQLHMLSQNYKHEFIQVEDPAFPDIAGWKQADIEDVRRIATKLQPHFTNVTEYIQEVCRADYVHAVAIKGSWGVLTDFYEVLMGDSKPEYL